MKYYYEKPDVWIGAGVIFSCKHPIVRKCTLFQIGEYGLGIVQNHFDVRRKVSWWGPIEPWIAGDIYTNKNFIDFFEENAAEMDETGNYPIFPVRRVMWALRMKPLRKEYWEDIFDS